MILTYKVKHNKNIVEELRKAKKVAEFGIEHKVFSSAKVKQFGLKSMIANQILRKYVRNRKIKRVKSVNLIIPNQGIQLRENSIWIPCLRLELEKPRRNFQKINQIELNREYAFISITINEPQINEPEYYVGLDLNTTGHCAVLGNPKTGKIVKMGKKGEHIRKKYRNIRKNLQKKGKYRKLKEISKREKRILRDQNHKISRKIVEIAKENNAGIRMEKLKGVRNNRKHKRSFNHSLNSWPFYQLQQFVEYKAKLNGVIVDYVEPAYTSQICSRCGSLGNRNDKVFKCPICGHVDHADANASFNIAKGSKHRSIEHRQ